MKLLTGPEVSERIVVPEQTLSQWRYLGKGPAFIRVGRHVRYREEDLEAWLSAQTRGGDAA